MPKQETSQTGDLELEESLPASGADLGKALALIHRVLPLLERAERAADVQKALRSTAALIESARQAHLQERGLGASAESVEAEIVAVIAAAVAALIDRPHRVVSVASLELPPPHLNVWALEGRTQLFMSHKVR